MAEKSKQLAVSPGHPFSGETVRRISPSANQGNQENMFSIHKNSIRIATWNVRSLFQAGKLNNVEQEMSRLKLNILGLSEIRWPNSGKCITENGVIYYSGNTETQHYNGVGIMLDKAASKAVINYTIFR